MIADPTMVLPTHNERERIAEIVTAVFAACAAHGIELELVIVDDNSPDGTGARQGCRRASNLAVNLISGAAAPEMVSCRS